MKTISIRGVIIDLPEFMDQQVVQKLFDSFEQEINPVSRINNLIILAKFLKMEKEPLSLIYLINLYESSNIGREHIINIYKDYKRLINSTFTDNMGKSLSLYLSEFI